MSCCNCCYWNTGKTMQIILKYWEKKRADKKVATTTKHIKCWVGLNQKHVRNIATWQHWCFRIVYTFEAFVCSVQRWNQFQNYLIKTIETVFISLAIYITNNWFSYGEWNECRYMYIEACMWQSPSMTNSKRQGRWPLKSPPLSPNHFKLLILCKNFVCVK